MTFWNGVASFGLGAQGYNAYNNDQSDRAALEAKRARDTEVANIELEKVRREDALAKNVRDVAAQYGLGGAQALPATPDTTVSVPQPVSISDEGEPDPLPDATKTVPGLPAAANRTGMYNAMADAYEKQGKLQDAANIRAALKQVQTEGYGTLLKGVASGADPDTIKQEFNAQGAHRIVNAQKDGDAYTFTHDDGTVRQLTPQQATDQGTKLGLFKKDLTIVPQGGTVIDSSGATVATGQPKPAPHMDPLSPEGIDAKKALLDYEAKLKSLSGDKATELQRNVKFLVDKGIATDEADAYGKLRTNMSRDRAGSVTQMMQLLKPSNFRGKADQIKDLRQQAESLYDSLHGSGATASVAPAAAGGAAAPVQLGGPGAPSFVPAPAAAVKPPSGYPEAQQAPDGKWYVKRGDSFFQVQE